MIRFDEMPFDIQQSMCTPMNRILAPTPLPSDPKRSSGALYLGSMAAILEQELLKENQITHLVQVLDVPWLPQLENDGFKCYRIDIVDQPSTDLRPHLEDACAYIDSALKNGESVLVHCQQGVSRSASIVIAYLIRNHAMSYDDAYALVKRERVCVKPNTGFVQALREWEGQWHPQPAKHPTMTGAQTHFMTTNTS